MLPPPAHRADPEGRRRWSPAFPRWPGWRWPMGPAHPSPRPESPRNRPSSFSSWPCPWRYGGAPRPW